MSQPYLGKLIKTGDFGENANECYPKKHMGISDLPADRISCTYPRQILPADRGRCNRSFERYDHSLVLER